jgi:hypothetical protein
MKILAVKVFFLPQILPRIPGGRCVPPSRQSALLGKLSSM